MATTNTALPNTMNASQALTYPQAMQNLGAIVEVTPPPSGVVRVQPGQLIRVQAQPGQHYKVRKAGSDENAQQAQDNVVPVQQPPWIR